MLPLVIGSNKYSLIKMKVRSHGEKNTNIYFLYKKIRVYIMFDLSLRI